MRLIKPVRYAGERDPEVLDKFITFLQRYFRFCPNCEEEKVIMAACFLDEDASQWWNQECGTEALPSGIRTLQVFISRLTDRFMPKSVKQEATQKLTEIKQGNLAISQYIAKFQALMRRAYNMDPEQQYNCFVKGLNSGTRTTVVSWAAEKFGAGAFNALPHIIEHLRLNERITPALSSMDPKAELKSDFEPMDVDAVGVRSVSNKQKAVRAGRAWTSAVPRKPGVERRKCFYCGKLGHIQENCRRFQKARELEELFRNKYLALKGKGKQDQVNDRALASNAAQCRGLQLEEPQAETLQESDQLYSAFQSMDKN